MLDVVDFIKERGGDPEKIRESQRRRHAPVEDVDTVITLWGEHQKLNYQATQVRSKVNALVKQIGAKKKAKEDADDLLKEKLALEAEKNGIQEQAAEKEKLLQASLGKIGNIVHNSIPVSNDEDNNAVLRTFTPEGVTVEKKDCLSHHDVLFRLDAYDQNRGVKVSGHRGYFLKGWGCQLTQALIRYGLDFLSERGYTELQVPHFMLGSLMARTAQISQFDEELYKVDDPETEGDKFLIATSEQPLSAFHASEWLTKQDVPLKYAGYSKCFRKEAGGHGRDTWGIYRVHEFDKVEQFVLTEPDKSWEMLDDMIRASEEFYQSLGLSYRVVDIVTGALNNAAARKFDLEAWFPFQGEYKELVSCSNCTDYQSRGLDIRFGPKSQTDARKTYVHCLNATLCATTRTVCAIAENYQTEEGVKVPEPLRKYMRATPEFMPYTKELPKNATSKKLAVNKKK